MGKWENSQLGMLAGGKLKTNNAHHSINGDPLPMTYQTSLGSYDIIGGLQYLFKTWDFYIAYQHPFDRNKNEYLHPADITDENKLYFESAFLKRGDDLSVRIQKTFSLNNKQTIQSGVLPIYRLQKSEIIRNGNPEVLANSAGLTLNLFVIYSKRIKDNTLLSFTGAFPIIDKDYRADGLTRNFVLTFKVTNLW